MTKVRSVILFLALLSCSLRANAASFTIGSGQTETAIKVLDADLETGTIESGGSLEVDNGVSISIDSGASGVTVINRGSILSDAPGGNSSVIAVTGIVSNDVRIENIGSLTFTNSVNDNAINLISSNSTILNSGTISGSGAGGSIVNSSGENAVITNSGTITTSGDSFEGVTSSGTSATITNSGTITTSGEESYAIKSSGDDATITNSGTITTAGQFAYAIGSSGSGSAITNSGAITASGDSADGIFSSGASSTVVNNGTITTSGEESYAIKSSGDDATITNSGTITTAEYEAYGVDSSGARAVITNSGTITTAGQFAYAIGSSGSGSAITNSGAITASGDSADGIFSSGASSTVVNNGTIVLSGTGSGSGISGGGGTINNNGTISVSGTDASGISTTFDNTIINNRGTISSALKYGVNIGTSQNVRLVNTGKIFSLGGDKVAIKALGSTHVTLGRGSQIIGAIDLGDGNDTLAISGSSLSAKLQVLNVENISISPNVLAAASGNNVYVVDPTQFSMVTTNLNNLALDVHGVINNRNSDFVKEGSGLWAQAFNSNFNRGRSSNTLSYEHKRNGFVAGYKKSGMNFGVIFGASTTDSKTDEESSFDAKSNSLFAGLYKNISLANDLKLSLNLIAGYEKYRSNRQLLDSTNGYQVAKSDFYNLFISPSLKLEKNIALHKVFDIRPKAEVSYLSSYLGNYVEKGSSSNIEVKARKTQILNTKIGLSGVLKVKKYELSLGAGLDRRFTDEEDLRLDVGGARSNFTVNNDRNVRGRYFEAGLDVVDLGGFAMGIDLYVRKASGDEDQRLLSFTSSYVF